MKRRCRICGRVYETDDPEQDICYDCEVIEELVDYEEDNGGGLGG